MNENITCCIENCNNKIRYVKRKLCNNHYMAWLRHGSTDGFNQYDHVCVTCGSDFKSKKAVADCCSDYCYARSPGGKAKINKCSKEYRARNPLSTRERNRLSSNTRYYFPHRKTCTMPGCSSLGERHHPDYNKPYEIVWLCSHHHRGCNSDGTHPDIPILKIEKNILWETRYFSKKQKKYEILCLRPYPLQKREIHKQKPGK